MEFFLLLVAFKRNRWVQYKPGLFHLLLSTTPSIAMEQNKPSLEKLSNLLEKYPHFLKNVTHHKLEDTRMGLFSSCFDFFRGIFAINLLPLCIVSFVSFDL